MKSIYNRKYKTKSNNCYFVLYLIMFLYNIYFCYNCDITHPIKKNGECISGGCTSEEFENNICSIENDIIKTQWITNIIKYSEDWTSYSTMSITPDNNLLCISSYYNMPENSPRTNKFFYGLKSNGRDYFINNNKETPFNQIDCNTDRNEGIIYGMSIEDDNKEYIIGFANNEAYFEVYDFEDGNTVYKKNGIDFFETGYNNFKIASIFSLNDFIYISFIANNLEEQARTFFLHQYLFKNKNIELSGSYTKNTYTDSSTDTFSSSCFLSLNHYIICFYLNDEQKYKIAAYDENLVYLDSTLISSTYYSNIDFYRCVHFVGDAGAFVYLDTDSTISIVFKEYYNGIKNYFSTDKKLKINSENYKNEALTTDMIRLEDKKFCVSFISLTGSDINYYIVHNYYQENIIIRNYN